MMTITTTTNSKTKNSSASSARVLRRWLMLWEDQHPLARNSVLLMLLMLGFSLLFRLGTLLGPHYLSFSTLFEFAIVEDVWFVAHILVLAMFAYGAIRLVGLAVQGRVANLGVVMMVVSIVILLAPFLTMPSLFESAVAYQMNQPYDDVLEEVQALCAGWLDEFGTRTFDPDDYDLGSLQGRVEVWRESVTVFFNFGDEEQTFGLACVLNGEDPPDSGYRTKNYVYDHISEDYYEFYEKKSAP